MATGDRRPPDFKLALKSKIGIERNNCVGVAWYNDHGINIQLLPGVTLTQEATQSFFLTLWPNGERRYSVEDRNVGHTEHEDDLF